MKNLVLHPLFWLGLSIKLALIAWVVPTPVTEWYGPFMQASVDRVTLDPWGLWMGINGSAAAFPYGYVMWVTFLPFTVLSKISGLPIGISHGLTTLFADVGMLLLLSRFLPNRRLLLLAAYWLSPITISASYILGFNDIIPVLLVILSLYFLKKNDLFFSGVVFIMAVSAKLSMIIALPFFFIYLFNSRRYRQFITVFINGTLAGIITFIIPFLLVSSAGVEMLFGNPEIKKIYELAITFGTGITIYVAPLTYILMLYAVWRIRRINFDLFTTMLGLAFLLVVLMTPASPGWFVWILPFLIIYQASSDRFAVLLVSIFSALYFVTSLYDRFELGNLANAQGSLYAIEWLYALNLRISPLLHTFLVATGITLAVRIWREAIRRSDYFRLSRRPLVIGIAGDSGAGKDTFSMALSGLFGDHSITHLSGDNYHLWDRQKPMWQVMTHLNPMANDLERFTDDLISLVDGKVITARHYDHETGRMSAPIKIKSNDIILASGLHALYLPILRKCYDLSIFLNTDENLRRHFKLHRDVNERGHTVERAKSSFERRLPDSIKFIRPQAAHADLVLSLHPIHPRLLEKTAPLQYKLIARSRQGLHEPSLLRVLVGICGLHVDMTSHADSSEVELTVEGDTTGEDIALAAQIICPRIFDFLDVYPRWENGMLGVMQLVALSHINQVLTKRFI